MVISTKFTGLFIYMHTQIFDSLDWQYEDELHKVINCSTRAIFSFFKKNI